jgi:hypothetical protein
MARRKKATHDPLPSGSYTEARAVLVKPIDDPTADEGVHHNWRIERPLTKEEQALVLSQDWQVVLPGGGRGAQTIRTNHKPRTWGMSPTRKEREAAHRRRIEEMRKR